MEEQVDNDDDDNFAEKPLLLVVVVGASTSASCTVASVVQLPSDTVVATVVIEVVLVEKCLEDFDVLRFNEICSGVGGGGGGGGAVETCRCPTT